MAPADWTIDTSHSSIGFTTTHMVFAKVHGTFDRWQGTISVDENDPTNVRLDIHIEVASIDTHEQRRDAHLRSTDFFDAENHPEITFTSTGAERSGGNSFRLTGDLTVRGITHEVVLDAEYLGMGKDPWGKDRSAYTAKTALDRTQWGLVWNAPLEAGGFLVGDTIELEVDVQAVRA